MQRNIVQITSQIVEGKNTRNELTVSIFFSQKSKAGSEKKDELVKQIKQLFKNKI